MKLECNNCIYTIFSIIAVFVISFLLSGYVFASMFWIHEYGHVFFGVIGNLVISGQISTWTVGPYGNHPFPSNIFSIFSIPVPLGVGISPIPNSGWFGITGILSVSLVFFLAGYWLYLKSNGFEKSLIVISVLSVMIYQFVSNFLCGTDNFSHSYFSNSTFSCTDFLSYSLFFMFSLFLLTSFVFLSQRMLKPKIQH